MRFLLILFLCISAQASALDIQTLSDHLRLESAESRAFTQEKYLEGFDQALSSQGYAIVDPRIGVQWQIQQPFSATQCWLTASGSPVSQLLLAILSGELSELEHHFEIAITGALNGWQLTLEPRSEALAQVMNRIHVSGSTAIESVTLLEQGGHRTELTFSESTESVDWAACD